MMIVYINELIVWKHDLDTWIMIYEFLIVETIFTLIVNLLIVVDQKLTIKMFLKFVDCFFFSLWLIVKLRC